MSDEAAFLAALKVDPADDTARLVYADWLDEHNEPVRAEYLRLVVTTARNEGNLAAAPGAERFVGFGVALAEEWRKIVGSRFSLLLDWFSDNVKTTAFVRELTGWGFGEAKTVIGGNPPRALLSQILFEDASRVCERVRDWDFLKLSIASYPPTPSN
ncbi:hypothetical protein VT84_17850 [Gemmata sp. SH-PL17]|uniref:TIGR02996 domain-containing protein n=1 Tax=Gemmata sp. SH-PL17 TaxID=1630693 RepID=UPI0004AD37F3|nr:TIGR02996 domain-containing protein [Gemmata sp. SH-PL17]AMV26267.1 hypothetical protein VT84_17850 [Gemmata sp. SH-PL17]